ncbi:MAG: hypothetical protein HY328_17470 [Chloroflexi bacterium]|nr:hypothetical protein [Chloroflexota bacterium]
MPIRLACRGHLVITGLIAALAILLAGCGARTVQGVVVDENGPVAGAVVRLRATQNATTSDAGGRFALPVTGLSLHRTVTAWKEGYYIGGADLTGFPAEVTISLRPHTGTDNPGVDWLPSDANPAVELACGNCHTELHADWRADSHSQAATKPLVQAMYNGSDSHGRNGVGVGFLLDTPEEVGNCAACHAPAAPDLNSLEGEAANGVFCQFCHSVIAAQQPYAETTAGVNVISLLRPPPGEHLFIGPYDDVTGRDTFSPVQSSSQQCAACHSGGWWGVAAYTSFDEWQASAYAAAGVQCQDCHMPALGAADAPPIRLVSACAPEQPGPFLGETLCTVQSCIDCHLTNRTEDRDPTTAIPLIPPRNPATVASHRMLGSKDPTFLRSAVTLVLTATQGADGVLAEVAITNRGAGHSIPTDGWMRNLILLVTAFDPEGNPLAYLSPERVPAWAGVGSIEQANYAGLPGKGFARLLEDWEGEAPAPPWRNGVRVRRDNRIGAGETDRSHYLFALPEKCAPPATSCGSIRLTARLIHRRVFKPWADAKGFDPTDTPMAEASAVAVATTDPLLQRLAQPYDTTLFAHSPATTRDGQRLDVAHIAQAGACAECHGELFSAWQTSGHARSASSPLYRARAKVASQNTQAEIAPFCAGCHTPIGLLSGQIRTRWSWFGQESYPLDAAAQSGVQCSVCHAISAVTGAADGAYVLDPARLGFTDVTMATADLHATDLGNELYATPEFCATCHEATSLVNGLPVMTTYSEWWASRFNSGDPATTVTCQGCHFADGRHGSLRREDLLAAATVDLSLEADGAEGLTAQVVVANVGAGHSLPTGATELQQMWLEVRATDGGGRQIFVSGGVDGYGDPLPDAVTFGTEWVDAEGKPTERLWEAASILRDQRIAAGGVFTATYAIPLPPGWEAPLRVRAALNYRAASGYLTGLMSIYLQEEVPAAPTVQMAGAERCWGCPTAP